MLSYSLMFPRFSRFVVVVNSCILSGMDAGVMTRGQGSSERPPQLQSHHDSFCCCTATAATVLQPAQLVANGFQLTSCCNLLYVCNVMAVLSRPIASPGLTLPWKALRQLFLGENLVSNVTT